MIKISVTEALKDYLRKKKAAALFLGPYEGGHCYGRLAPPLWAEPVPDKKEFYRHHNIRCVHVEVDGIEIMFDPWLKYYGDEIKIDYRGRLLKDVKCEGLICPGIFSPDAYGKNIKNIFFENSRR